MPFTLRYIQYMVINVLHDQQYMFGVRSLLVDEKALLIKIPGRCVVLTTDAAIAAVTSLIWSDRRVSISVQINLDDMLKTKMWMFDISPGFIAERIHFSGTRNSQWCLTLGKW